MLTAGGAVPYPSRRDAVAIQCLSRNLLLPIHHLGDRRNGVLKSSAAKSLGRSDECWAVFQTGTGREEY